MLLSGFIGVIWDMDRPYSGVVAVEVTDMTRVAGDLAEEWAEDHPDRPLPCDERGELITEG